MPRVRSLPIRVAPITGEALDSWLDALSARLDSTLGELTVGSGILQRTATFYGQQQRMLRQLTAAQTASLASLTEVDATTLTGMTLSRYASYPQAADPPHKAVPFAMLPGSRYCPACLAETGGRWQLSWRLPWTFACILHPCYLADTCPSCGRRPEPTGPQPAPWRPPAAAANHARETPTPREPDLFAESISQVPSARQRSLGRRRRPPNSASLSCSPRTRQRSSASPR